MGKYKAIVIGGSAGSFPILNDLLSQLPADYNLPILVCMHRLKHIREGFTEALSYKSKLKVIEPYDKQSIKKGIVYIAPANYHMSVELGYRIGLSTEDMINYSRPAIDITLGSAGYVYKQRLVGIILSGANKDGALGLKQIKDFGGTTIIQDPKTCAVDTMPVAAQNATTIDYCLSPDEILNFLLDAVLVK